MSSRGRTVSLAELAQAVNGKVEGDPEVQIDGVSGLENARPGTIVRVEHRRYLAAAEASAASALLVGPEIGAVTKPSVQVADVKLAFAQALAFLFPETRPAPGVHATAVVADDATLAEGCSIGPYAVIGAGARLEANVVVHAHVVIGEKSEIGEDCTLFPHVVLYPRTCLGKRVRIHSGTVIGADGYGYHWTGKEHLKIPQVGHVRISDDVEIGANTAIDRATTGETFIGPGTKIDNLVQIGHNVRTGAHCLLISQVGVAGSATLGNGVVLAGKSGVKDHVKVGDGVMAGGQAGIWSDLPAGAMVSGHPARPHRDAIRIEAALGQLPALLRRVRELERRLGQEQEAAETE